jgi:cytochrome c553
VVSWLILVVACGNAESVAPEPEPAADDAAPDPEAALVALHMSAHAKKVTLAREALVHGQLDASRQALQWLSEHAPPEGLPEESAPFLAKMQATAKEGAVAERYDQVGDALGRLAVTCGACHTALGASPSLQTAAAPPGDEVVAHMVQHAMGVDQLWASLVTNDPAKWRAGVETLGEPLHAESFDVPMVTDSAKAAMQTVHTVPANLVDETDPTLKGRGYGQVLAACATCHAEMRGE